MKKTIILTGVNGGIGKAIAEVLHDTGHKVLGVDHAMADLQNYKNAAQLKEQILTKTSSLDWIVCAHGFVDKETNLEKQRSEDIESTFQVNIISLVYLVKLFIKNLKPNGGIIFISSTAGIYPNGNYAAYSASKAAVNAFSQSLARHYPKFSFFSICPGPTNTSMREKIAGDAVASQPPSAVAAIVNEIISGKTDYKSGDIIVVKNSQVFKVSGFE